MIEEEFLEEEIEYKEYEEEIIDKFEQELAEIESEQEEKIEKGKAKFTIVNHIERAATKGRQTDGDTTWAANIALEYFGNRCALSGEEFKVFDKKISGKRTNLSAEHVVALSLGGDDIIPNIVPSVLQYNIQKNGYYLLDYWTKAKDIDGKEIYSDYRLLKLVNFMMKSLEARKQGLNRKEHQRKYKKFMLEKLNGIEEYLKQIEEDDRQQEKNADRKILSDTVTATTLDEDNKKILTKIPTLESNIPELSEDINIPTGKEQQEIEAKHHSTLMMDIFLTDAVEKIKDNKEISSTVIKGKNGEEITIEEQLEEMLEEVRGVIPFELTVRNEILKQIKELGIGNEYTVANDLLVNTELLEQAKENKEELKESINKYLEEKINSIELDITKEKKEELIGVNPSILYDEEIKEQWDKIIRRYTKDNGKDIDININLLSKTYMTNILLIKAWIEEKDTTKPPAQASKDEEEKRLGQALSTIRSQLIKPYIELEIEDEKEQYNREHPELEKVMAIVEEIDRNNPRNKNKVKQVVKEQKSKGDLGKNKEVEKGFDDVIKEKEGVDIAR